MDPFALVRMLPKTVIDTVEFEDYRFEVLAEENSFKIEMTASRMISGRLEVKFKMTADTPQRPPLVLLQWHFPMIDTHLMWNPSCGSRREIQGNWWYPHVHSRSSQNAPVMCLHSMNGENRLTFALMDALNASYLAAGVEEETADIWCAVLFFTDPMAPFTEYETTLILDDRKQTYSTILDGIVSLWEGLGGYEPAPVPEEARLPMYSTWYSYHQAMNPEALEGECKLAKAMGMESIIVDDGWQTDDNSRGYAYCGDWEVTSNKFPDFKAHVTRVHEIGMKYVLWFSVPFVGKFSKAYEQFKGKYLNPNAQRPWHVLDPRFLEVRQYLSDLYCSFITRYDIDGFKLDFIDAFQFSEETQFSLGEGRDIDSLAEAIDRLMTDVTAALRELKPDVLIEFRQRYIGPVMRKYGNMLRAGDVPNNFHGNRIEIVDVRLLAGKTAVHSDMIMWNYAEPVESAAMQLVHVLFSVPQISVRLAEIPEAHTNMLRFYLNFWREHRDVLLDGEFMPEQPGMLYPIVQAKNKEKLIAACYSGRFVDIRGRVPDTVLIVNGTMNEELLINFQEDPGACDLIIWDCEGAELQAMEVDFYAEPYMIAVPPAGVLQLKAMKMNE